MISTNYMVGDIVEPTELGEDCEVVVCGEQSSLAADGTVDGLLITVLRPDGTLFHCRESDVTPKQAVIAPQRSTWVAGQPRPTS